VKFTLKKNRTILTVSLSLIMLIANFANTGAIFAADSAFPQKATGDEGPDSPPIVPPEGSDEEPTIEPTEVLTPTPTAIPERSPDDLAPLIIPENGEVIADQYIVVYKSNYKAAELEEDIRAAVAAMGGRVIHMYASVLNGYSAYLPNDALQMVREDQAVAYIQADTNMAGSEIQEIKDSVQFNPTWGLDRIDQRDLPLNSLYTYDKNGKNVHIYVLSSGIRETHAEFDGRIGTGYEVVDSGDALCNGTGTHLAGIAAGTSYGVAKQATVHGVRVAQCDGSTDGADILAGMDWVAANNINPSVAIVNYLYQYGTSNVIDSAVNNLISLGIITIVPAPDATNLNACNYSPSRVTNAITVSSTNSIDERKRGFGSCLDLFAPGEGVTSAWYTSDLATGTLSGSGMAAAHVAGAAALYLQTNPAATVNQVANAILLSASENKVSNPGTGSPNELLYTLMGTGGGVPETPSPVSPDSAVYSTTPKFTWKSSSGATSYALQVYTSTGTLMYIKTIPSSNCAGGTCNATPSDVLVEGNYKWRVAATNTNGTSPYSAYMKFSVASAPITPKLIMPVGAILETRPKFKWEVSSGATAYVLQVYTQTSILKYTKTIPASNCVGETCSAIPPVTLTLGNYKWRVAGKNGTTIGPYSAFKKFTIATKGFDTQFNGTVSAWTRKAGGTWGIYSGSYYSTTGLTNKWSSAYFQRVFSSFDYEALVKRDSSQDFNFMVIRAGVKVDATDSLWYPAYLFGYHNGKYYSIWRVNNNGSFTAIQNWAYSSYIKPNDWNKLRVVASGADFKFYINDKIVKMFTNHTYVNGYVGFITYHGSSSSRFMADWATLTLLPSKYSSADTMDAIQEAYNQAANESEAPDSPFGQ